MTVLSIALGITLAAITIVLLMGIGSMARGGEFNRRNSNKLMQWRVILQGVAVCIVLLMFLVQQA